MKRNYGSYTFQLTHLRRVKTADGFTRVQDPPRQHTVIVDIDMDVLAIRLGQKAVKSKSGKAKMMYGVITVTEKRR